VLGRQIEAGLHDTTTLLETPTGAFDLRGHACRCRLCPKETAAAPPTRQP